MPEIGRFFGIIVAMFYSDHRLPHFQVRYGRQRTAMGIEMLSILEGDLAPRGPRSVVEWAAQHQAKLLSNWNVARRHALLNEIAPLE